MSEQNIQSKSQLAKLLATENISFQHDPSAKTAYFDVKNRVLVLPVWQNISNDLYDMLVVHEVGHALDTPADGWIDAIDTIAQNVHGAKNDRYRGAIKGFLNVIEDARIDKRQKRRYPGAKRNYIAGYKELIERDFFGTSKQNVNDMSFIDRLNMYFKGGAMGTLGRIIFDKEEAPLVKRVEAAETFEDVIALTEEIYRFSKEKGEEQQQNLDDFKKIDQFAEGDDDGDFEEYEDFDSDDDDAEADTDGEGDQSDESEDDEDGKSSKAPQKPDDEKTEDSKGGFTGAGETKGDVVPQSETERAWEENLNSIVGSDDINYIYVNLPKVNIENIVDDYKIVIKAMYEDLTRFIPKDRIAKLAEGFNKFKAEENATISYMVKEFESRKSAEAYSKISVAKTGVIDTNKLHSYRYNDDIFRRLSVLPNGKNHGFIMFLDWSGSMTQNMQKTVKQLISLTMFCKRVQIPFEVYFFRDLNGAEYDFSKRSFEAGKNTVQMSDFRLRNILSSRMSLSELNLAYNLLWVQGEGGSDRYRVDPMGGTPLNQAIIAAELLVKQFRKNNKLEIVNTIFLTDGDSNSINGVNYDNLPFKPKGNRFILKDDVMKKEYNLGNGNFGYSSDITNIFLRILKDRTNSNLIGFFLSSDKLRSIVYDAFGYSTDISKYTDEWKKNKFISIQSKGYDDYYVINAREMDIKTEDYSINTDMTRSKIAKEFMKFAEKKSVNRVLLSRFIEKISGQSKKVA